MQGRTRRRVLAGAIAVAAVAGGGTAIAASGLAGGGDAGTAILNDAARQLGVEPQALEDALTQATLERIDDAVADGRLTEEQADDLKERVRAGGVPLLVAPALDGRGFHGGFGDRHGGPFEDHLVAAAGYLGLSEDQLESRLADGDTLADVARAEGKTVDGLVDALLADERRHVEDAVADGRLTEADARNLLEGLRTRVTDLVAGRFPLPFGDHGSGPPPWGGDDRGDGGGTRGAGSTA